MSWLNPWQLRPYVVAVGPIEEHNIARRFMSMHRAIAYCEDQLDLRGDDVSVWYQYDVDGYIKVPLVGEKAPLAATIEEHAF